MEDTGGIRVVCVLCASGGASATRAPPRAPPPPRTHEKIFTLMKKGRIEDAAALADKLDPSLVPEAEELVGQIDMARQAAAWSPTWAAISWI